MDQLTQKELVRARYGGIAEAAGSASCCAPAASCCGPTADPVSKSREMGYSDAELAAVPEGPISASAAAIRRPSRASRRARP
jgi:hypothetical protein